MADMFTEVEEAIRREKLENLWRNHGRFFIIAIVAVIITTGLVSGWRSWNQQVNAAHTEKLLAAFESDDPAQLQQTANDLRPGLRGVALLTAAGLLVEKNKTQEALPLYEKAANDDAIPSDLRDLAMLSHISLLPAGDLTPDQQTDFQKSLKKIWSNDKSPWRYHARLQAASLLAASAAYADAADLLEPVLEVKEIPPSLAAKIRALHHVYRLQAPATAPEQETKNTQG